ncbi:uncharacterized protein LOC108909618 [Anoplophora glabripennis]|uniref:uncharacterized protein LOC108909618 n=1 Tax=Anoplophora glabripennis TaxID=217634 RepID=UPI0008754F25|nr:uncharacterized protein LOC108909618 [Anoplophora glabripennis]
MLSGKCHPLETKEVEDKWEELSMLLNSVDSGARKDKKQWKTFLYEWKSKTKKKARQQRLNITKTGGGGYICSSLTNLENRLMGILGWIHVIGCPDLPPEVEPRQEDSAAPEIPVNSVECVEAEIGMDGYLSVPSTSGTLLSTPLLNTRNIKKKFGTNRHVTATSNLEKSAKFYSESTQEMAAAIKEMANAICQLAEAFSKIAGAVSKNQDAKNSDAAV